MSRRNQRLEEYKAKYCGFTKLSIEAQNAFCVGYGEGYADASEDAYSSNESAQLITKANATIDLTWNAIKEIYGEDGLERIKQRASF